MKEFIFAAPLWMPLVVAGGGAALLLSALRRGDRTLRLVAVVLLAGGLGWVAASRLVETDAERVDARTRELVAAVEQKNWTNLETYLHPEAGLSVPQRGEIYSSRGQIIMAGRVTSLVRAFPALRVAGVQSHAEGARMLSDVEIDANSDAFGGRPNRMLWRFTWVRAPGGGDWVVDHFECVDPGPMGDLTRYLKGGAGG